MIENGVINRFQLWLLTVNFAIGSALLLIPSSIVSFAKKDAWLSMLVAIVLGSLIQFVMVKLAKNYPNKTLIDILRILLGKPIGNMIGILYAWFFLHLSALVIRNAADFIHGIILPKTPLVVFSIMAGLLLYLTIYHGIEVVARSNEMFSPYAIGGFWLTVLLVIPLMKVDKILPLLENGVSPVFMGAYPTLGFPYAELIVFMMFFPYLNSKKNLGKIFISAGIVAGFSLFITVLSSLLVLNIRPTEMSIYSTFNMARLIDIGQILTRVEAIIALAYIIVIFTKIIVSFYGGVLAISQVFGINDYRPILFPLILIVMTLSITLNRSIVEEINFAIYTWPPYSLFFGFVLPFSLLILAKIKKKSKKTPND